MIDRRRAWVFVFVVAVAGVGGIGLRTTLENHRSPEEAIASGLGPVANYKKTIFEDAIAGLVFREGRVEVDSSHPRALEAVGGTQAGRALLQEGDRRLATHNNVIGALSAYSEAILNAPEDGSLYLALGEALLWKKKVDLAEAAIRTAVDREPNLVEARVRLGWVLNSRARRAEAAEQYRRAIELAPDHAEAHLGLARSEYYAGNLESALGHSRTAARLGGTLPSGWMRRLESGPPAPLEVRLGSGTVVGPQVRVDTGGGTAPGNETSIASSSVDSDQIVASWNDYRSSGVRTGVGVSLDGGATWTDFLVRPPVANRSSVEGDPMTAYDNRTGTLWVGAISFAENGGLFVAKKRDGLAQFDPSVHIGQVSFADKGWMAAGPAINNPDVTRLYIAYNEGVVRSEDLGATWAGPVPVPGGLGFNPRVGPSGALFVAYSDSAGVSLLRSFNGGQSFQNPIRVAIRMDPFLVGGEQVPGTFRVAGLPAFAVDPVEETHYCIYPDSVGQVGVNTDVDLFFTMSTNRGGIWTNPVNLGIDEVNDGDQFFPWLEVDEAGTLHLLYYDTQNTVQDDTDDNAFIDAYYAYSSDRGATWTRERLTSSPFNSQFDGFGSPQFIGDYLGLGYAGNKVYPCYLSTQNGDSDVFVHEITTPPAPVFDVDLTALVPGEMTTLSITGARPGTEVVIHWTRGGIDPDQGPCPSEYGGLCLDLIGDVRDPARRTADENGEVSFTRPVPDYLPPGLAVQIQVVNVLGPNGVSTAKSPAIDRVIQ